jgi:hypothetical protein
MSAGRVITRLVRVTIPGLAAPRQVFPAERRDPVASNYVRVTGLAGLFAEARELSVRTMIFDVEPLVAPWHGSKESLDQGIARILGGIRTVPSVRVVVFATNSARRPSAVPACGGLQVRYLASAGKPLRIAPYHDLPRPGAVAGDQLPTNGILAYRLGFTFLHYGPKLVGVPLGPGLMHRWGELVRPVLFRRSATYRDYSHGVTDRARRRTGAPAEHSVIAARADKACRPGWFSLFRLAGRRSSGLPGDANAYVGDRG